MPSFNGKVDLQIPQFLNICVILLINKFFILHADLGLWKQFLIFFGGSGGTSKKGP